MTNKIALTEKEELIQHPELETPAPIEIEGGIFNISAVHPHGNRMQRRHKQRHHPYFTKTRTGGRLWEVAIRDEQRKTAG
jgi:hypothetical protein